MNTIFNSYTCLLLYSLYSNSLSYSLQSILLKQQSRLLMAVTVTVECDQYSLNTRQHYYLFNINIASNSNNRVYKNAL